jgi:hypothetical protein
MLKEKAPKCVSSFLGPGWIVSEEEKDQWEGGILSKTPDCGGECRQGAAPARTG